MDDNLCVPGKDNESDNAEFHDSSLCLSLLSMPQSKISPSGGQCNKPSRKATSLFGVPKMLQWNYGQQKRNQQGHVFVNDVSFLFGNVSIVSHSSPSHSRSRLFFPQNALFPCPIFVGSPWSAIILTCLLLPTHLTASPITRTHTIALKGSCLVLL